MRGSRRGSISATLTTFLFCLFVEWEIGFNYHLKRAANETPFPWRADDGPTLNAGLVALIISAISSIKKPYIFVIFQGVQTPCPPLDPHMKPPCGI